VRSGDVGLQFLTVEQILQGAKPLLKAFEEPSIHVWGYVLEGGARTIERCHSWLSGEERLRATRFIRSEDQQQYILARGGLRLLLSSYTGLDPAAVIMRQGPEGKPGLDDQGIGPQPVRFNLSHSHGRMLVGIAGQRDVGVDLEQICSKTEIMKLAKRFYAPAEFDAIASHDASGQSDAFYRHWVAKEAFLKFKGVGLKFPLGQCRVTMALAGGSAGIHWQKGPAEVERGFVKFLPLPDGWVGAVAAEGSDWAVRFGEWM
jgi:4'-phosphopantetheinyl transferase